MKNEKSKIMRWPGIMFSLQLKIKTVFEIINIMQKGKSLGDAGALKLTLINSREEFSDLTPLVLEQKKISFTPLDKADLESCRPDSLGYHYFHFLKVHNLTPINFSPKSLPLYDLYPISMRYIRLHDLTHVLLGIAPDIPGELGVYSFILEQNYTKTLNRAAHTAKFLTKPIFWKKNSLKKASLRGYRLAQGAKPLVAQPLENLLNHPIKELRKDFFPQFDGMV